MSRFRAIIVDDEDLARTSLCKYVDWATAGFELVASFESGETALDFLRDHAVDLVLTDIKMAGRSGVDLARVIATQWPSTRVAFLSAYREFEYARQGMEHHVVRYLLKPVTPRIVEQFLVEMRRDLDEQMLRDAHSGTCGPSPGEVTDRSMVTRVSEYVAANATQPITLEMVARHVNLNPAYLSRAFKRLTGERFTDLVARTRVEKAKTRLAGTNDTVQSVAHAVGYRDTKHFYRIFRSLTGSTPAAFRVRARREADHENSDPPVGVALP